MSGHHERTFSLLYKLQIKGFNLLIYTIDSHAENVVGYRFGFTN